MVGKYYFLRHDFVNQIGIFSNSNRTRENVFACGALLCISCKPQKSHKSQKSVLRLLRFFQIIPDFLLLSPRAQKQKILVTGS